jgi:hypothetical protein
MPEPTFLQIQGGGDSSTRMIELPPGPVRIGRGSHCEVRLVDPGLGDVHCMLRRRGATWHFQPVGPAGHVWIEGRAADQQRPIPLGVPFRVGEHWLILRPATSANNDWGTFDAPITIEPRAELEPEGQSPVPPTAEPANDQARARPTPTPPSDDNEERLRRWEARLEHRERWLKDRQEERRWEARWKSAGESLRARSAPPTAKPHTPPHKPAPPPTPPTAPRRPSQTPPVARIIEPKRAEPILRVAEPAPRPPAPRVVVRPMPEPPAPIRRPVVSSPSRVEIRPVVRPEPPQSPPSRALVTLAPPSAPEVIPAEAEPVALVEVDRPEPGQAEEVSPGESASPLLLEEGPGVKGDTSPEALEQLSGRAGLARPMTQEWQGEPYPTGESAPIERLQTYHTPHPSPVPEGEGAGIGPDAEMLRPAQDEEPIEASDEPAHLEPCPTSTVPPTPTLSLAGEGWEGGRFAPPETLEGPRPDAPASPILESEPEQSREASTLIESSGWVEEALPIAIEEARQAEIAPLAVDRPSSGLDISRPSRAEPPALELPRKAGPLKGEWPSARDIFAAQARRSRPESEPEVSKTTRRKKSVEPEPTDVLAPPCWSLPRWLGWFPVLLVTLMVGIAGVALAYEWTIEANNANLAIRLATRPESSPGSTIDPALIPRGGWWSSTATHQAAWAMALVRAGDGEDHSEDIRSLLDSSRNASRLAARARFVVDLPDSNAPGSSTDLSHLGRTRDVVTLVWTGRRLRKEGKLDSALRAYRSAMEIASKTSLGDLDPPAFFEDPQVRRYALPRESLLAFVAKAMVEDGEWTREQWAEALPPSATASLVASRVFAKMQKRADADRLADLAIRQSEEPTLAGYDPAEDRAAGAEALAYRGRWPDAAAQYRLAIDLAEDDATRRMWWLNLAEVALRANDDAGRDRAIEAAKSPTTVDEITRRALQYQQSQTGLGSARTPR